MEEDGNQRNIQDGWLGKWLGADFSQEINTELSINLTFISGDGSIMDCLGESDILWTFSVLWTNSKLYFFCARQQDFKKVCHLVDLMRKPVPPEMIKSLDGNQGVEGLKKMADLNQT